MSWQGWLSRAVVPSLLLDLAGLYGFAVSELHNLQLEFIHLDSLLATSCCWTGWLWSFFDFLVFWNLKTLAWLVHLNLLLVPSCCWTWGLGSFWTLRFSGICGFLDFVVFWTLLFSGLFNFLDFAVFLTSKTLACLIHFDLLLVLSCCWTWNGFWSWWFHCFWTSRTSAFFVHLDGYTLISVLSTKLCFWLAFWLGSGSERFDVLYCFINQSIQMYKGLCWELLTPCWSGGDWPILQWSRLLGLGGHNPPLQVDPKRL